MTGRIPDSFLDELVSRSDIVDIVSARVPLKKAGREYKACCPFHNEKSPSFSVNPEKQVFFCFGCKASGTVFDFVMRRDRCSFSDALEHLAQQAGVELPKFGSTNKQSLSERQALLEAHSAACGLFEKSLADPQFGVTAREYLAKRGFTDETIKHVQAIKQLNSISLPRSATKASLDHLKGLPNLKTIEVPKAWDADAIAVTKKLFPNVEVRSGD